LKDPDSTYEEEKEEDEGEGGEGGDKGEEGKEEEVMGGYESAGVYCLLRDSPISAKD